MKRNPFKLLLATVLLSATGSAFALIDEGYEAIYYSDASFTTQVGQGGITCIRNNKFMIWGETSPYFQIIEKFKCCFNACMQPPHDGGGVTYEGILNRAPQLPHAQRAYS